MKKVAVLSDLDSRLKWGLGFAFFMQDRYDITVYLKEKDLSQLNNYYLEKYKIITYRNLIHTLELEEVFLNYDIIFLSLGGGENIKFFYYLDRFFDKNHFRPLVISGMNGLTDSNDMHALLCRVGSDIICINSLHNLYAFKNQLFLMGLSDEKLFYSGYSRLYNKDKIYSSDKIKTVLFIEQPGIPRHIQQKKYLIGKILEYVKKYPSRKVIIKKRSILHKQHMNVHMNNDTIFDFFKKSSIKLPKNLFFDDSSIEILIQQADLCVSFYSTAIVEAVALGVKAIVINDFGIGKSNENHHFIGSNLMVSLNDWIEDRIPNVNLDWKMSNCKILDKDIFLLLEKMILNIQSCRFEKVNVFYNRRDFEYFYNFLNKKPKFKIEFFKYYLRSIFIKIWK